LLHLDPGFTVARFVAAQAGSAGVVQALAAALTAAVAPAA
jgi:hypothetical protein